MRKKERKSVSKSVGRSSRARFPKYEKGKGSDDSVSASVGVGASMVRAKRNLTVTETVPFHSNFDSDNGRVDVNMR